jgi:hypothetical protein
MVRTRKLVDTDNVVRCTHLFVVERSKIAAGDSPFLVLVGGVCEKLQAPAACQQVSRLRLLACA